MKLPSLDFIISKSSAALKRFPWVLASAAIAAFVSVYLVEQNAQMKDADALIALVIVAALGISFFFALKLISEKQNWSRKEMLGVHLFGTAILAGYFLLLPEDFETAPEAFIYRYLLYLLASHLLVAVGPYLGRDEISGFWQYNKTLFLRILTAVLFSGVLYVGLVIALGSIDVLLGVDIDSERYGQLFILIGGIFNTWFFLSGIPASLNLLNRIQDYPKGLKIFTQNILIPLITIYVVILYLYMGKIIFEWTWPEGWVAYLVLSFSIAGIFALLLLHPIREKIENRWIKKFSSTYFWTLVPLVILLLLAIWRRIWEYSFTVNRYFVLLLGLWLAGIVGYFIISRRKNIKVIPASLGIIAFLISFGPWGAFSVSEYSQTNRLENYLLQHNILVEGTVRKTSEPVPFEDRKEISSIVRYLSEMHGTESLQPWFEENLSSLSKTDVNADTLRPVNRYEIPQHLTEMMGIEYVNQWQTSDDNVPQRTYSSTSAEQQVIAVDSYDWMVSYQYPQLGNKDFGISIAGDSLSVRTNPQETRIKIYSNTVPEDTLQINLYRMIRELRKNYDASSSYNIPPASLKAENSNDWLSAVLYLESLHIGSNEGKPVITSYKGKLLLRFKE